MKEIWLKGWSVMRYHSDRGENYELYVVQLIFICGCIRAQILRPPLLLLRSRKVIFFTFVTIVTIRRVTRNLAISGTRHPLHVFFAHLYTPFSAVMYFMIYMLLLPPLVEGGTYMASGNEISLLPGFFALSSLIDNTHKRCGYFVYPRTFIRRDRQSPFGSDRSSATPVLVNHTALQSCS